MTSSDPRSGSAGDDSGVGSDERFRKSERLRKRPQFLNARRNGWRTGGRQVVVYVVANSVGHPRIGITVSGRVGNAVVRNRWKRRIREIFRRSKERFGGGLDTVVIVTGRGDPPPFDDLKRDVLETTSRAVASYRQRRD